MKLLPLRGETRCLAPLAFSAAIVFSVALSFLAPGASQASGPQQAQAARTADYQGLLAALRTEFRDAKPGGRIHQPFFSVRGRVIRLGGDELQVFEYRDSARADADAARVSRDGRSIGTSKVHWLGPPHFFKKGRLLALYLGTNDRILKHLDAALGPQFAGD